MEYSKEFLELIDGLSDDQIEQAQENATILQYCDEWMKDVFRLALAEDTWRYSYERRWYRGSNGDTRDSAYRLDRAFKRPEEKAGRWVECDVVVDEGMYFAQRDAARMQAIHMCASVVGFGGFQFEGQGDGWFIRTVLFLDDHGVLCAACHANAAPAIPIKARFWVEE